MFSGKALTLEKNLESFKRKAVILMNFLLFSSSFHFNFFICLYIFRLGGGVPTTGSSGYPTSQWRKQGGRARETTAPPQIEILPPPDFLNQAKLVDTLRKRNLNSSLKIIGKLYFFTQTV